MNSVQCKKRALITGATGYIGSNLVHYLLKLGWDVHVISRSNSNLSMLKQDLNSITVHQHDGTSSGMMEALSSAKPHIVFHLASLFLAQHNTNEIEGLISSNLLFSTQLLEAMAATGVKYFVNTGTSWQYYLCNEYNPVNLYAATKQAFECILMFYTEACDINATTLLLFDTYGPNDPRGKLIPLLWKAAVSRQPLEMSLGEQLIELIYIDDVVRAFGLAAESLMTNQEVAHTRYGVASNEGLTLIDLVKEFELVIGEPLPISFGKRPYRPREVMKPWCSYQKVPGWKPEVSLKEGIIKSRPAFK